MNNESFHNFIKRISDVAFDSLGSKLTEESKESFHKFINSIRDVALDFSNESDDSKSEELKPDIERVSVAIVIGKNSNISIEGVPDKEGEYCFYKDVEELYDKYVKTSHHLDRVEEEFNRAVVKNEQLKEIICAYKEKYGDLDGK